MIFLRLFYEFAKAGLFAVGGGLATLPFLYDISDKTGWFTHEQLADMVAISESTPGPIGVNTATYVGFTTAGVPGAIVASIGLVFPSIVVIILVAQILERFKENKLVASAFYGLRPASTGLIAGAGFSVVQIALLNLPAFTGLDTLLSVFNLPNIILAVVLFCGTLYFKKLHPVVFLAVAAVAGIVFQLN